MKRDTVPFTAEVLLMCAIFGSIFALVLSGCGRSLPAADAPTFTVEDATPAIEPTPDPAPAIVSPEPEQAVELPSVVKTVAAKHTCKACGDDCQCDVCCCDEAKMVNGVWHRRWKGTLYKWQAFNCSLNGGCNYQWVPIKSERGTAPSVQASRIDGRRTTGGGVAPSDCSSCQSGTVRRYQPMTRRGMFGRWR